MVSEVNPVPEPEEGPLQGPHQCYFPGLTVTRTEPHAFGVCCDAMGLDPDHATSWVFVIDGDGLHLIIDGDETIHLPWHVRHGG